MIRALVWLVVAALVAAAGLFAARLEGEVAIRVGTWAIAMKPGALLLLLAVLLLTFALLEWVIRSFVRAPRALRRWRAEGRRRRALDHLTEAYAALAAGEPALARDQSERAAALLGREQALPILVRAEAAEATGDHAGAKLALADLARSKAGGWLGRRGLAELARRRGDIATAQAEIRRATDERPRAPKLWAQRFQIEVAAGAFEEADRALATAARLEAWPQHEASKLRTVLALHRSRVLENEDRAADALTLAEAAVKIAPTYPPAVVQAATLLARAGRARPAERLLHAAFDAGPHPDLVQVWIDLGPGDVAKRVGWVERLVGQSGTEKVALLARARALMEAGRVPEATDALAGIPVEAVDRDVIQARAQAAELAGDVGTASRLWKAAALLPPGPRWICQVCHHEPAAFETICSLCQTFGSQVWSAPHVDLPAPVRLAARAAAEALPAAGSAAGNRLPTYAEDGAAAPTAGEARPKRRWWGGTVPPPAAPAPTAPAPEAAPSATPTAAAAGEADQTAPAVAPAAEADDPTERQPPTPRLNESAPPG